MKKSLLSFVLLLLASFSQAEVQPLLAQLYLQVRIIDPTNSIPPIRRSPIAIPIIYSEGYHLYFETPCDNGILRLVNEEGDVEYSTSTPANITTLTLPSYLSGVYELQIIRGQYCFYGYVEL